MAEPFKLLLDADVVRRAGRHLQRTWPAFDRRRFERLALDGLDALELKARAMHIADALEATLPPRFGGAAEVIEAALRTPLPVDGEPPARDRDDGLAGWIVWSLGECWCTWISSAPRKAR